MSFNNRATLSIAMFAAALIGQLHPLALISIHWLDLCVCVGGDSHLISARRCVITFLLQNLQNGPFYTHSTACIVSAPAPHMCGQHNNTVGTSEMKCLK